MHCFEFSNDWTNQLFAIGLDNGEVRMGRERTNMRVFTAGLEASTGSSIFVLFKLSAQRVLNAQRLASQAPPNFSTRVGYTARLDCTYIVQTSRWKVALLQWVVIQISDSVGLISCSEIGGPMSCYDAIILLRCQACELLLRTHANYGALPATVVSP